MKFLKYCMPHWLYTFLGLKADERGASTLTKTKVTTRTVVTVGLIGAGLVAAAALTFVSQQRQQVGTVKQPGIAATGKIAERAGTASGRALPCTGVSVTANAIPTTVAIQTATTTIGLYTIEASPAGCTAKLTGLNVTASVTGRTSYVVEGRVVEGPKLGVMVDGTDLIAPTAIITRVSGTDRSVDLLYTAPGTGALASFTPSKTSVQVRVFADTRGTLNPPAMTTEPRSHVWVSKLNATVIAGRKLPSSFVRGPDVFVANPR